MIDGSNNSEVVVWMVAVILYKIDDADPVSHLALMGFDYSLKVFGFIGSAVNEDVLVCTSFDMLEAENGTICIKLGHLLKGEGVDVRVDCELLRKDLVFLSFCIYL